MSSSTEHSSSSIIKPLNDTNFSRWKRQMTAVMKEKKIWKYVTGTFTASTASAEDDQKQPQASSSLELSSSTGPGPRRCYRQGHMGYTV